MLPLHSSFAKPKTQDRKQVGQSPPAYAVYRWLVKVFSICSRSSSSAIDIASFNHEMRNTLNSVVGLSEVLIDQGESMNAATRMSYVNDIHQCACLLRQLVDDISFINEQGPKAGKIQCNKVFLHDVLVFVLRCMKEKLEEKQITVSCQCPVHAVVLADKLRLQQVLMNLLSNAYKYNREGGEIYIDARINNGGRMTITVSDSGLGVPNHCRNNLFKPFARFHQQRSSVSGTGLGLFISRQLVEGMGGRLEYQPNPSGGSIFCFDLEAA